MTHSLSWKMFEAAMVPNGADQFFATAFLFGVLVDRYGYKRVKRHTGQITKAAQNQARRRCREQK